MSLPNAESYNEKISNPSDSIERSAYCLCELPRGYPITKKHFFITASSVRVLGPERLIPFPFVFCKIARFLLPTADGIKRKRSFFAVGDNRIVPCTEAIVFWIASVSVSLGKKNCREGTLPDRLVLFGKEIPLMKKLRNTNDKIKRRGGSRIFLTKLYSQSLGTWLLLL